MCLCVRVCVRRVELGKHCGWINTAAHRSPEPDRSPEGEKDNGDVEKAKLNPDSRFSCVDVSEREEAVYKEKTME